MLVGSRSATRSAAPRRGWRARSAPPRRARAARSARRRRRALGARVPRRAPADRAPARRRCEAPRQRTAATAARRRRPQGRRRGNPAPVDPTQVPATQSSAWPTMPPRCSKYSATRSRAPPPARRMPSVAAPKSRIAPERNGLSVGSAGRSTRSAPPPATATGTPNRASPTSQGSARGEPVADAPAVPVPIDDEAEEDADRDESEAKNVEMALLQAKRPATRHGIVDARGRSALTRCAAGAPQACDMLGHRSPIRRARPFACRAAGDRAARRAINGELKIGRPGRVRP